MHNVEKWSNLILHFCGINNMMRYAIWYHLHNLKNVKNAHGGVLLLVKLQAFNCSSFLKSQIATIYILHLSGIWHLCVYWFII